MRYGGKSFEYRDVQITIGEQSSGPRNFKFNERPPLIWVSDKTSDIQAFESLHGAKRSMPAVLKR